MTKATRFLFSVTLSLGLLLLLPVFSPLGKALAATSCAERSYVSGDANEALTITSEITLLLKEGFDISAQVKYLQNEQSLKICLPSTNFNNDSKEWISLFFDLFLFFTFHFVMISMSRVFFIGL